MMALSRDVQKRLQRALARNAMFASSFIFTRLPYSWVKRLARFWIGAGFLFVGRQKRIAEDSLRIAFGRELNADERNRIIRRNFENLGMAMIELMYLMAHPDLIASFMSIEGEEHLKRSLAKGRGVILVSAHFGNFPLMLLWLAQRGYPMNAIIRPTRDAKVEAYFQKQRKKLGLNTIYSQPRKTCVDQTIRALRRNEVVFIPLDQNFGSKGGVYVDFFGQKAATATGPVVFARRTGADLLPIFVIRRGEGHHIVVEPPFELETRSSDEETVGVNVARITRLIEQYIRRYPHEWGWMHRRWKSRPPEEQPSRGVPQQSSQCEETRS